MLSKVLSAFTVILLVGCLAPGGQVEAQDKRSGDVFYIGAGASITDYAGDADGKPGTDALTDRRDFLFDTERFTDGGVFPYSLSGELGYRLSPAFSAGLAYRFGQYAFIHGRPFTTQDGPPGSGGDLGTVRHTIEALGRYTLKAEDWTVAPYLSGGLAAVLGGRRTGIGPSVGVGIDVAVGDRTSLFLEVRSSVVIDDEAADGIETSTPVDALSDFPAVGVRRTLRSEKTPPRVLGLECPTEPQVGTSVSFSARLNAEEMTRPVEVRWRFGDGRSASGQTVSHAYGRPGTYEVVATARSEAGTAEASCSVTAAPRPEPAMIASIDARPSLAAECDTVRFEATVEGDRPIERAWQLGDGTTATGGAPGEPVTHVYGDPGEYTARLIASNEQGTARDSVTVRVQRPAVCGTVQELNAVTFARGTSELQDEALAKLRENADVLRKCRNLGARIEGTAAPGEPSPQALSEARAEAVAAFYEERGLSEASLQVVGTGAAEDAEAGKKGPSGRLRRVETIPVQVEAKCPGGN